MFDSSLRYPDKPEWKYEPSYHETTAAMLDAIFHSINLPDLDEDAYQRTVERAERCLSLPMSVRQRMLLHWAQGMSYMGLMEWRRSSDSFESAFDLAEALNDQPSCAELAYLNGRACAADLNYASAKDYNKSALSLLQELLESGSPSDLDFEARIFLNLGTSEYVLEQYDEARSHFSHVKFLLTVFPSIEDAAAAQGVDRLRQLARVYWAEAVLERWIGLPETAFQTALRTYDMYERLSSSDDYPAEIATIGSIIAETAIDLADGLSMDIASSARRTQLTIAQSYIENAADAATTANDALTASLVLLANARYETALGAFAEAEDSLASVCVTAEARHNLALSVQIETTRGRLFAARAEQNCAEQCFQTALDIARSSDLPALGIWAKRALLWERERR